MKFFAFVILISLLNSGCGQISGDNRTANTEPKYRVKNSKSYNEGAAVLFGDSIARGLGASSDDKSLVGCLLSMDYTVFNYALDGATSTDSLNDLQNARNEKPSIVVISLGGNDVMLDAFYKNLPESETLKNIRQIFKSFTEVGSLVLYLGLNPPKNPNLPINVDISRLKKIKNIAKEEGVIFLDESFLGLWGDSRYMSDELHPNDKGYEIVCNRVKASLKPHLK